MSFDPRDYADTRDRDDVYGSSWGYDPRERDDLDRELHARERDPRDPFVDGLDLPRGPERELVQDHREHLYELNRDDSLDHLRDQGLIYSVQIDVHERGDTLTERGWDVLEARRRDRDDDDRQQFHAGVSRDRELQHDSDLFRAYLEVERRLREQGAEIDRIVLEVDLRREYQEWLQEHNRGRSRSDGRPDRDEHEIEVWARQHDLPYFDETVHFPDFRIEYELDGRDRHEDVEVVTPHYRGAHAASRAQAGFTCIRGGGGSRGGRPFDPRAAEDLL
jgi:hypothetical protein